MNGPLRPYTRYFCPECRGQVWTGAYLEHQRSPEDAQCLTCGVWLVEFDAPKCPHPKCRRSMKPTNTAGTYTCPHEHRPRSVKMLDPKTPYKPTDLPYAALSGERDAPPYFAPSFGGGR